MSNFRRLTTVTKGIHKCITNATHNVYNSALRRRMRNNLNVKWARFGNQFLVLTESRRRTAATDKLCNEMLNLAIA